MKTKITGLILLIAAGCAHDQPATTVTNHPLPSEKDVIQTKPDAPLTANTHFAAGQVAESQGDYPRAMVQYLQAVKLDPSATVPLLRMAMIYTKQRDFDEAIATWQKYIKLTNGSAAGYCDLGYTLEMNQRFGEAESAYKTAVSKEPTNEVTRVNYGLMLARLGRMDAATVQLSAVLTPAEAHYNIASVLESQGKIEAAKVQYNEALRLDPDMADAKARLASIN